MQSFPVGPVLSSNTITVIKPVKECVLGITIVQKYVGNVEVKEINKNGLFKGTHLAVGMSIVAINGQKVSTVDEVGDLTGEAVGKVDVEVMSLSPIVPSSLRHLFDLSVRNPKAEALVIASRMFQLQGFTPRFFNHISLCYSIGLTNLQVYGFIAFSMKLYVPFFPGEGIPSKKSISATDDSNSNDKENVPPLRKTSSVHRVKKIKKNTGVKTNSGKDDMYGAGTRSGPSS